MTESVYKKEENRTGEKKDKKATPVRRYGERGRTSKFDKWLCGSECTMAAGCTGRQAEWLQNEATDVSLITDSPSQSNVLGAAARYHKLSTSLRWESDLEKTYFAFFLSVFLPPLIPPSSSAHCDSLSSPLLRIDSTSSDFQSIC